MTDKIVTHADLRHVATIERIMRRNGGAGISPEDWADASKFVRRLIEAAEADRPPLPEGWVLLRVMDDRHRVLWHKDGWLYRCDDCSGPYGSVEDRRDHLTLLRPTVTEADVEKAARAFYEEGPVIEWSELEDSTQVFYRAGILAAFEAAGIEVQ